MSFQESNNKDISPNLALSTYAGQRYPNQFFDLSQQYMPPTIKELFKWCTFYYYNSPLIGASMKKVSRYPITDMIFEDSQDSVKDLWDKIFNKTFRIKSLLIEINLDYHVYGNAFVSMYYPSIRFLVCKKCGHRAPIQQWNWNFRGSDFIFQGTCANCGTTGQLDVHDRMYKDLKKIKVIRWNPENMQIKYNEFTGRYSYYYSVPAKIRNAIMRGDKDILQDIPLLVVKAVKDRALIRFNSENLRHLRAPTLAEQDQGWGKPTIIHVLKDMYYLYTLRRAQEAIALEHIVPFDIIHPVPNAQQDPYVHTDLGNWRKQIEHVVEKHRRDPNFKAVLPVPVGFGRLGGDGKAMLLSPELGYLNQTIVGGMGMPQEFLFGGLNWTGSSISLRTMENDFIQNRTQLLDLVHWMKDKIRIMYDLPDVHELYFADFRMADDIQKNQQLIGLNANAKISDQTMLTELGYDYEQEVTKMIEETMIRNYLNELQTKSMAKSQGEAQIIQFNYQQKVQELAKKAQEEAEKKLRKQQQLLGDNDGEGDPSMLNPMGGDEGFPVEDENDESAADAGVGPMADAAESRQDGAAKQIGIWAHKLIELAPQQAQEVLMKIKKQSPKLGMAIEAQYHALQAARAGMSPDMNAAGAATPPNAPQAETPGGAGAGDQEISMEPMPEQKPPRRKGAV